MVLNKEIQSQQRLDSLAEVPEPASPRQPRKALVSSESYLQRLSMASRSSLWQEIPVVRNSTVLLSMTHEDQKLQEVPDGAGWGGERDTGESSHPYLPLTTRCTLVHARLSVISTAMGLNCSLKVTTSLPLHLLMPWAIHYHLALVQTPTERPRLQICREECGVHPITTVSGWTKMSLFNQGLFVRSLEHWVPLHLSCGPSDPQRLLNDKQPPLGLYSQ